MDDIYIFGWSLMAGIISGVTASYIFLRWYLFSKKPIILISNYICKDVFEGHTNYFFKIVNKTNAEIFDVRMELTFNKPIGDFVGKNVQSTDLNLIDDFFLHLPMKTENDEYNKFALRIRTTQELDEMREDDASSFIQLKIIARHSYSGFYKVFTHIFHSSDCITEKKFITGESLDVQ